MSQIRITRLAPIKLPLVQKLYKSFYSAARPKKNELILVAYAGQTLAAVVRLRTVDHCRLLTGMLVIPEFRGTGLGKQLLEHCQREVLSTGDYCFAFPHLENYYSQYGFHPEACDVLPAKLKEMYQRYTVGGNLLTAMKFVSK